MSEKGLFDDIDSDYMAVNRLYRGKPSHKKEAEESVGEARQRIRLDGLIESKKDQPYEVGALIEHSPTGHRANFEWWFSEGDWILVRVYGEESYDATNADDCCVCEVVWPASECVPVE